VHIRRIEDQIIQSIFTHSKDSATIIHFSTQSVYGDPRPRRWVRWRNPYGRTKRATERQVHLQSRSTRKPAFILRLGHVCGSLQEISNTIRADIRARSVNLPMESRSSNAVYTATIMGAIAQIIARRARPDTYDLMNTPRWTWQEVYAYEAAACGVPLAPQIVESPSPSWNSAFIAPAARLAGYLASAQPARELFAKVFAYVPEWMNARAMAWWYSKRARTEIAALHRPKQPPEHLSWVENGEDHFPAENATIDLLRSACPLRDAPGRAGAWPADLPDAQPFEPDELAVAAPSR
jgi:nucleoside-diphosphate-sugar epimerase